MFTYKQGNEYLDDSQYHVEEDMDDDISYGTEYQLERGAKTGVFDGSSVNYDTSSDTNTPSYQEDKPVDEGFKKKNTNK